MADNHLTLEVLGPDGVILKADKISSINVRLENGILLGLRPGHAPLIGMTVAGNINYKSEDQWNMASIDTGILAIDKNEVRILTTSSM